MKKNIVLCIFLLFYTNAYGQSGWIGQYSNTNSDLYSVQFINSSSGYCSGSNGMILKTINGGSNWTEQYSGFNHTLRSLYFTFYNTGYIAGDSGLLIKTTNGGNNWFRINIGSTNNFTSVNFVNDSTGYTGGSYYFISDNELTEGTERNHYYKTTDYGNSWDSIEIINAFWVSYVYFCSPEFGWSINIPGVIGGSNLYKTTDSGQSWNSSFFTSRGIYSIFFIDTLYGWVSSVFQLGVYSTIRTTNGGLNWSSVFPGTGVLINSLYFTNRNKGWGAGDNSIIQATTDGGVNWFSQIIAQQGINYNSVYFIDSLTGWVTGDNGTILKTTTGGVLTGITNTSTEIPDIFILLQNYPNPFNPVTNLGFGISSAAGGLGFVSLRVYDIKGKEVVTLVNENKQPGYYNVQFDGSKLSSGVYFYRLETKGFVQTKRMMLIK